MSCVLKTSGVAITPQCLNLPSPIERDTSTIPMIRPSLHTQQCQQCNTTFPAHTTMQHSQPHTRECNTHNHIHENATLTTTHAIMQHSQPHTRQCNTHSHTRDNATLTATHATMQHSQPHTQQCNTHNHTHDNATLTTRPSLHTHDNATPHSTNTRDTPHTTSTFLYPLPFFKLPDKCHNNNKQQNVTITTSNKTSQ